MKFGILVIALSLFASCASNQDLIVQTEISGPYYVVPVNPKEGLLSNGIFSEDRYPVLGLAYWKGYLRPEGGAFQRGGNYAEDALIIADDEGKIFSVGLDEVRVVARGEGECGSFHAFYVKIRGTGFGEKDAYEVVKISHPKRPIREGGSGVGVPVLLLIDDKRRFQLIEMTACKFAGLAKK